MNRNFIRKLILQEFKKRIDEAEGSSENSREAAAQYKELLEKNAALFGKGIRPGNGVMLSESQARALATNFYEATESGTNLASGQLFGMGTDEDLIIETLKKIPTLADLSFVSHVFSQKYKGLLGGSFDLADSLQDEYSSFTSDEFYDVRAEVQAIYKRGLFALDGEVFTVEMMEEAARAVERDADVLKDVSGEVGSGPLGEELAGSIAAAGVAAGTGVGAAAGVGAALGLGGAAVGIGSIPAGGYIASAIGTTAAGTAGFGAGAAAGSLGTGLGGGALAGSVALLGGIPVAGWVLLGAVALSVGAYVAFSSGDFDESELKMLKPDFYLNLEVMFKDVSKRFKDAAAAVKLEDFSEEGSEGSTGPGGEGKEYDSLPFGLERSFIENIVRTMNAYDDTRGGLEGYIEPTPAEAWNRSIQNAWKVFAPHALLNCAIYEFHRDEVDKAESWLDLSKAMKSDFPGYTPNPRGCLAFCLDAYYDEVRYGKERPSGGGSGGGGGGGKDKDGPPAADPDVNAQRGGGGKIIIRSVAGSKGNVPLSDPFNESVENDLIKAINQQFSEKARRSTVKAVSLEFDIKVTRGGNIRVRRRKPLGAVERDNFKGNLQRMVKDALQDRMQVFTKKKRKERDQYMTSNNELRITIDVPGGYKIPR